MHGGMKLLHNSFRKLVFKFNYLFEWKLCAANFLAQEFIALRMEKCFNYLRARGW